MGRFSPVRLRAHRSLNPQFMLHLSRRQSGTAGPEHEGGSGPTEDIRHYLDSSATLIFLSAVERMLFRFATSAPRAGA